jgi:hypothetical protein
LGSSIICADVFLSGCTPAGNQRDASGFRLDLLDEVAETIFPETAESPGAKSANAGAFMKTIVTDCYTEEDMKIFLAGQEDIDRRSSERFGNDFLGLNPRQRHQLLVTLDEESRNQEDPAAHYFTMMHQLTVWGYFSSETGATQALRYNQVPGRFDGCIPYNGETYQTG